MPWAPSLASYACVGASSGVPAKHPSWRWKNVGLLLPGEIRLSDFGSFCACSMCCACSSLSKLGARTVGGYVCSRDGRLWGVFQTRAPNSSLCPLWVNTRSCHIICSITPTIISKVNAP